MWASIVYNFFFYYSLQDSHGKSLLPIIKFQCYSHFSKKQPSQALHRCNPPPQFSTLYDLLVRLCIDQSSSPVLYYLRLTSQALHRPILFPSSILFTTYFPAAVKNCPTKSNLNTKECVLTFCSKEIKSIMTGEDTSAARETKAAGAYNIFIHSLKEKEITINASRQ